MGVCMCVCVVGNFGVVLGQLDIHKHTQRYKVNGEHIGSHFVELKEHKKLLPIVDLMKIYIEGTERGERELELTFSLQCVDDAEGGGVLAL